MRGNRYIYQKRIWINGCIESGEICSLVDNVEMKLDEADEIAENTEERLSHDDVFQSVKSVIHGK